MFSGQCVVASKGFHIGPLTSAWLPVGAAIGGLVLSGFLPTTPQGPLLPYLPLQQTAAPWRCTELPGKGLSVPARGGPPADRGGTARSPGAWAWPPARAEMEFRLGAEKGSSLGYAILHCHLPPVLVHGLVDNTKTGSF